MDKSVFYEFINPGEEKTQGIVYLLIEMFKIRRYINMHPDMAKENFEQKWSKSVLELRRYSEKCQSSNVK